MPSSPLLVPSTVVLCALLAACGGGASRTTRSGSSPSDFERMVTPTGDDRDARAEDGGDGDGDAGGTRVELSADVTRSIEEYLSAPRLILGDVVEIDMSRKPFFGLTTIAIDTRSVKREETVDGERGLLTITLTNTTDETRFFDALPNVRIAHGFEAFATRRLVLRYWTRQTLDRPIHLRGVARGEPAVYAEGEDAEPQRGRTVEVHAEVQSVAGGYRFEHRSEVKP